MDLPICSHAGQKWWVTWDLLLEVGWGQPVGLNL